MNEPSDIQTLTEKIEELTREKQHVLSIISHDLRSPLNRIFALIRLTQMVGDNLTEEQKDYLEKMHLIVADGLAMMRNLVDYRNLEYRDIDIMVESINVGDQIETIVKNFRSVTVKKNIKLEGVREKELIITSDKQCVGRILDNLIGNAIKFSGSGTTVRINTASIANDRFKIEVKDEAPGFVEEDAPKIFQKFQKLSARPTAGESTTGLGLFIAQSMAGKIGGKIFYSAGQDRGSVFTVDLPKKFG